MPNMAPQTTKTVTAMPMRRARFIDLPSVWSMPVCFWTHLLNEKPWCKHQILEIVANARTSHGTVRPFRKQVHSQFIGASRIPSNEYKFALGSHGPRSVVLPSPPWIQASLCYLKSPPGAKQ